MVFALPIVAIIWNFGTRYFGLPARNWHLKLRLNGK
jgi:hypothetical protein